MREKETHTKEWNEEEKKRRKRKRKKEEREEERRERGRKKKREWVTNSDEVKEYKKHHFEREDKVSSE